MPDSVLDRDKLRTLRVNAGWSRRELGRRCAAQGRPVAASQITNYERGRFQPLPATLKAIAGAFGLRATDLLTETRQPV